MNMHLDLNIERRIIRTQIIRLLLLCLYLIIYIIGAIAIQTCHQLLLSEPSA